MRKSAARNRHDSGFSLVEVSIAVVILIAVGATLFASLQTGSKLTMKSSNKSLAFTRFAGAIDIINAAPYKNCSSSGALPYTDYTLPPGFSIDSVQWMSGNGDWKECSVVPTVPPVIQRVVLRFQDEERVLRRTLVKTFNASSTSYKTGYSVLVAGSTISSQTMGPVSSDTTTDIARSVTLTSLLAAGVTEPSANMCYYIFGNDSISSANGTLTSNAPVLGLSTSCGSSVSLDIEVSGAKAGTYSYDIGGFNTYTGDVATPANLTITVKPRLQVEWTFYYKPNSGAWLTKDATSCPSTSILFTASLISSNKGYCVVSVRAIDGTGTGKSISLNILKIEAAGRKVSVMYRYGNPGYNSDAELTTAAWPTTLTNINVQPASSTVARLFFAYRPTNSSSPYAVQFHSASESLGDACAAGFTSSVSIFLSVTQAGERTDARTTVTPPETPSPSLNPWVVKCI